MESFIKADIFFFITSVAVIVLAVLGAVLLGMMIAVLNEVRKIASRTRREVEGLYKDVHAIRAEVREGASAVRAGIEKGVDTITSYAHTARAAGGAQGVLTFLLETVRELRASGQHMHAHTRASKQHHAKKRARSHSKQYAPPSSEEETKKEEGEELKDTHVE